MLKAVAPVAATVLERGDGLTFGPKVGHVKGRVVKRREVGRVHVSGWIHKVERWREVGGRSVTTVHVLDSGGVDREPVGHVVAARCEEAGAEVVSVVRQVGRGSGGGRVV